MYSRQSNNRRNKFTRFQNNGGQKHVKKLDPNLFIRKAGQNNNVEEFVPTLQFSDLHISDKLKRNIFDHGYTQPTEIQEKAIPPLLKGRDIIGIANTGTG